MKNTVSELRAAFDNVLARLPLFDERKTITVEGMALPLGVGGSAPTRLHVFPLGEPSSNDDRKWRFTVEDLENAVKAFRARSEPLPILYDHGKDPSKGSKAAGWVDSVELMPDGLYANVRWTDQARAEIRSGEWGFRSPGWEGAEFPDGFIAAGPLNEISLVNLPAIAGMLPVAASVNPAPPEAATTKESGTMSVPSTSTVEAKAKASAFDKPGILAAIKGAFPGMFGPDFPDEGIAALVMEAFSGGTTDEPAEDPMMPAEVQPQTPAVPFASAKAEDAVVASATAPAESDELKKANEEIATLKATIKAHEARELSGKIINASAADRKAGTVLSFADRIRTQRNAALGAAAQ